MKQSLKPAVRYRSDAMARIQTAVSETRVFGYLYLTAEATMAEAHCNTSEIGAELAHNLNLSLNGLLARGLDPGPREAKIRSLRRTLTASVRACCEQLARLGLPETATGLALDRLERSAQLASGSVSNDHRTRVWATRYMVALKVS